MLSLIKKSICELVTCFLSRLWNVELGGFSFFSWAQLSCPSRETIGSPTEHWARLTHRARLSHRALSTEQGSPTEQGLPVPYFKKGPAAKPANNTKCWVCCYCKFVWTTKTSIVDTWCMGDVDPILCLSTSSSWLVEVLPGSAPNSPSEKEERVTVFAPVLSFQGNRVLPSP